MSFHELPKTAIVLIEASDVSDSVRLSLRASNDERKCIICHTSTEEWIRGVYCETPVEVSTFSEEMDNIESIKSLTSKEVVFLDFDIYQILHGFRRTVQLLAALSDHKRIFVPTSYDFPNLRKLEKLSNGIFSIESVSDNTFETKTTMTDKKGSISKSEHTITFASTGKPVFKLRKTPAIAEDCSLNELQITEGHSAVELPFFASKHEDGVAIRDATTKKIRIGGQVVYEPDRDDDFDDSDPDDDLNI